MKLLLCTFLLIFVSIAPASYAGLPDSSGLAADAKERFVAFVYKNIPAKDRLDYSILIPGRPDASGDYDVVEIYHPQFQIVAENLEAQRATLSTADKLNGAMDDIEWRGYAIVRAEAYRVVERVRGKTERIKLWESRVDKSWHPLRTGLPIVGNFMLTKKAGAWDISRWRGGDAGALAISHGNTTGTGVTGNDAWLDPVKNPKDELRLAGFGRADKTASLLTLTGGGDLTAKPVASDPALKPATPPAIDAAKALEACIQHRKDEIVTIVEESQERKYQRSADENPYYMQRKTREFHTPKFEAKAEELSFADRLNGITGRSKVFLHYEAARVAKTDPEPQKNPLRFSVSEEKWSGKGKEDYWGVCRGEDWHFVPYWARDRDPLELKFRLVPPGK